MSSRATRFHGGRIATPTDSEMTGAAYGFKVVRGTADLHRGGTAGIGFAIARRLVGEGASVVISGRVLDRARRVAVGVDPSVEARAVDVMGEESIVSFFNDIGAIDHLVLAAAKVGGGRFHEESSNVFVRFLVKCIIPPLMPFMKFLSTPKRAARVITKVLIGASDQTGVYYDKGGHPMLGCMLERDPKFTERVVAETRALLSSVSA